MVPWLRFCVGVLCCVCALRLCVLEGHGSFALVVHFDMLCWLSVLWLYVCAVRASLAVF